MNFFSELLKDQLKPGMKALDVGSGSGILTVYMALLVGTSGSVVGIGKLPPLYFKILILL